MIDFFDYSGVRVQFARRNCDLRTPVAFGNKLLTEPDLKRIGAVKSFFEAFAYRTIAYNLEHVVSLFFFDHIVENQCGFTEAIYDFNCLISSVCSYSLNLNF